MKLLKKLSVVLCAFLTLAAVPVFAKNNVSDIDILVSVRDDGSARVVQKWKGSFYEGTENYIVINDEDIEISELNVSDESGEYQFTDSWDIDKSFGEKAGKCGFHRNGESVELCFGITKYGEREYTIEYVVDGFIKSYSDFDGTNFMLINPEMSTFPTKGSFEIELENGTELNEQNAGIWAFGYEGEVEFRNGKVFGYTTEDLQGENSMILLLRMDKGIVSPTFNEAKTFEEVKEKAFDNSDYSSKMSAFDIAVITAFLSVFLISDAIAAYVIIKRKRDIKKFYKEAEYFREVPNGGDMCVSYYLSQTFGMAKEKSLIMGALMLSMVNEGCIVPENEEKVGIFGKSKSTVNMVLVKEPEDEKEKRLYKVLKAASGEDGILQAKELEKYSYKHPNEISDMIDDFNTDGEAALINMHAFAKKSSNTIKGLGEVGKKELGEAMGLKKYLEDFSLIGEREIKEAVIWQDYMVYATLFGIADKVIEQFKEIYPDKISEFEEYNGTVIMVHGCYRNMYAATQKALRAQRVQGAGGSASIGGGGGFSGGGSGGGSR